MTREDFLAALDELDRNSRQPPPTPTFLVYTPTTTRRRDRPATLWGCNVEHMLYVPRKPRLRPRRNRVVRRG